MYFASESGDMADAETPDNSSSDNPYNWQSLDRLCGLLGLSQKEVLDQIGRGIERLRIGGNTLLRVAEGATGDPNTPSDQQRETLRDRRHEVLDARWETVLQEYREGVRERPNDLAPRAAQEMREGSEPESSAISETAHEDSSARPSLHAWSRFPGWFGPLFESDELAAS